MIYHFWEIEKLNEQPLVPCDEQCERDTIEKKNLIKNIGWVGLVTVCLTIISIIVGLGLLILFSDQPAKTPTDHYQRDFSDPNIVPAEVLKTMTGLDTPEDFLYILVRAMPQIIERVEALEENTDGLLRVAEKKGI